MLRIAILKTRASGISVVLRMNHSVYDGLSMEHIISTLHTLYVGDQPAVPPRFARYMQFLMQNRDDAYKFWRSVLRRSSMTVFKTQYKDTKERENGTWSAVKTIKAPHSANTYGITPATVFTTACAFVIGQETESKDVVFGRIVSGRQCLPAEIQHVVGPCTGAVPTRVSLDAATGPIELLRKVQEQYVSGIPYETVGLGEIRENCTDWPGSIADFSCVTAYQNFNMKPHSEKNNQRVHMGFPEEAPSQMEADEEDPTLERAVTDMVSMHDVDIAGELQPDGVSLRVTVAVNRRLCERSTVDRMLHGICNKMQVLEAALRDQSPTS
jgi:hypothetical protein